MAKKKTAKRKDTTPAYMKPVKYVRIPLCAVDLQALAELRRSVVKPNVFLSRMLNEAIFAMADFRREHGWNPDVSGFTLTADPKDKGWLAPHRWCQWREEYETIEGVLAAANTAGGADPTPKEAA